MFLQHNNSYYFILIELQVMVEYCHYGSLLEYMRKHCSEFVNQVDENDQIDSKITTGHKVEFSRQNS